MNRRNKLLAIGAILLTVIFWGYSFVSTKIILNELPPISIAFLRQVIAASILIVILLLTRQFIRMPIKDILILAASSLFGIVLYFLFENIGLKYTTASNGSIIVAAVPIFTLLSEAIFYKMKITFKTVVCVLLSVIGVSLVIFENGAIDFSEGSAKGNILMLGAMVVWVIYTILCKSLTHKYSGIVITTYQMIAASILFIPFVILEMGQWQRISAYSLANLLYLAIFCSALAYYLYNYAVKWLGATVCSMFINLIPVVTILGGVMVLHESISLLQITGMLLITASLIFVRGRQN